MRNHKKTLKIVIGALVAAAAVMGATFYFDVLPGSLLDRWFRPAVESGGGIVTATVTREDVEEIYQANGSIISNESLVVNAESSEGGSTSGYVVSKVNVKVGDQVQEGDTLFTLDMSQTENELALKQKQLALQESSNAIDSASQQRALEAKQRQLDGQNETAVAQAETDTRKLQQSADDVDFSIADNVEAAANVRTMIDQENAAKAAYQTAQSNYNSKESAYNALKDKSDAGDHSNELSIQLAEASTALSRAQTTLSEAKATYQSATSARESAESTLSSKDQEILKNYRALLDQGDTAETNARTQAENIAAKEDAVADQAAAVAKQSITNQSNTLEAQEAIRTAEEKLALNSVTAPISGTVTTVNVLDGQRYSGTKAIVIQNMDSMKATADIPEAKIADLPVGTKVRLTTDATGEMALNGEISFVSPIPTSQQAATTDNNSSTTSSSSSSSSTKPKYQVNVQISDDTSRLFIGMTAKLNFILKSNPNSLAVPSTAIQNDGMGNQYVTVVQGDGSDLSNTKDVIVTTGAVGDSMTAITSGNLQEGDIVIDYGASDADDEEAATSTDGVF